ncbi:sensor domain-containing diguanylate cyclase [Actinomycetospora cinnamomea]|uniref:Diguanylate cyclase (GGDEF)-like protein n=1 Tax=Actinomycetospora cinnamomea TaxID=663609 RepID=A0A2U1EZI3_9PSEU|nr:GGDEF domain-containing protein [Actinomycetospora cinnamomea]PVZ05309.1 diguanylate cyclase (GGDEF)-like protein [Actinomycetospora cinnamomea]
MAEVTEPPVRRFDPRRLDPRRWSLWQAPRRVVVAVLVVDVLAVVLSVAVSGLQPIGAADWRTLGLLALGLVVHVEIARGIERRREVAAEGQPYIELKSVWSFAGLFLLPLGLALVLVVLTFAYWWARVSQRPVPHRWTYSAATVLLASTAAWGVLSLVPGDLLAKVSGPLGLLVLVAAGLTRWTVNHGLVVFMICLSAPGTPWWKRLGSPTDTLIGLGALALGAALAVVALTAPWLLPVLLVPVMGMHRGFLLQQFARAARTDPKTGLANATAWRDQADRELARLRRRGGEMGVIMVDLDAFKAINDRHGHLVGDAVLRAVADTLRSEVRPYDAVGRFGGEEFVVLLAEADPDQVGRTAERLRRRISECEVAISTELGGGTVAGLTASIGTASYPQSSQDLDGLMVSADAALYAAKHGGRNRVECAPPE